MSEQIQSNEQINNGFQRSIEDTLNGFIGSISAAIQVKDSAGNVDMKRAGMVSGGISALGTGFKNLGQCLKNPNQIGADTIRGANNAITFAKEGATRWLSNKAITENGLLGTNVSAVPKQLAGLFAGCENLKDSEIQAKAIEILESLKNNPMAKHKSLYAYLDMILTAGSKTSTLIGSREALRNLDSTKGKILKDAFITIIRQSQKNYQAQSSLGFEEGLLAKGKDGSANAEKASRVKGWASIGSSLVRYVGSVGTAGAVNLIPTGFKSFAGKLMGPLGQFYGIATTATLANKIAADQTLAVGTLVQNFGSLLMADDFEVQTDSEGKATNNGDGTPKMILKQAKQNELVRIIQERDKTTAKRIGLSEEDSFATRGVKAIANWTGQTFGKVGLVDALSGKDSKKAGDEISVADTASYNAAITNLAGIATNLQNKKMRLLVRFDRGIAELMQSNTNLTLEQAVDKQFEKAKTESNVPAEVKKDYLALKQANPNFAQEFKEKQRQTVKSDYGLEQDTTKATQEVIQKIVAGLKNLSEKSPQIKKLLQKAIISFEQPDPVATARLEMAKTMKSLSTQFKKGEITKEKLEKDQKLVMNQMNDSITEAGNKFNGKAYAMSLVSLLMSQMVIGGVTAEIGGLVAKNQGLVIAGLKEVLENTGDTLLGTQPANAAAGSGALDYAKQGDAQRNAQNGAILPSPQPSPSPEATSSTASKLDFVYTQSDLINAMTNNRLGSVSGEVNGGTYFTAPSILDDAKINNAVQAGGYSAYKFGDIVVYAKGMNLTEPSQKEALGQAITENAKTKGKYGEVKSNTVLGLDSKTGQSYKNTTPSYIVESSKRSVGDIFAITNDQGDVLSTYSVSKIEKVDGQDKVSLSPLGEIKSFDEVIETEAKTTELNVAKVRESLNGNPNSPLSKNVIIQGEATISGKKLEYLTIPSSAKGNQLVEKAIYEKFDSLNAGGLMILVPKGTKLNEGEIQTLQADVLKNAKDNNNILEFKDKEKAVNGKIVVSQDGKKLSVASVSNGEGGKKSVSLAEIVLPTKIEAIPTPSSVDATRMIAVENGQKIELSEGEVTPVGMGEVITMKNTLGLSKGQTVSYDNSTYQVLGMSGDKVVMAISDVSVKNANAILKTAKLELTDQKPVESAKAPAGENVKTGESFKDLMGKIKKESAVYNDGTTLANSKIVTVPANELQNAKDFVAKNGGSIYKVGETLVIAKAGIDGAGAKTLLENVTQNIPAFEPKKVGLQVISGSTDFTATLKEQQIGRLLPLTVNGKTTIYEVIGTNKEGKAILRILDTSKITPVIEAVKTEPAKVPESKPIAEAPKVGDRFSEIQKKADAFNVGEKSADPVSAKSFEAVANRYAKEVLGIDKLGLKTTELTVNGKKLLSGIFHDSPLVVKYANANNLELISLGGQGFLVDKTQLKNGNISPTALTEQLIAKSGNSVLTNKSFGDKLEIKSFGDNLVSTSRVLDNKKMLDSRDCGTLMTTEIEGKKVTLSLIAVAEGKAIWEILETAQFNANTKASLQDGKNLTDLMNSKGAKWASGATGVIPASLPIVRETLEVKAPVNVIVPVEPVTEKAIQSVQESRRVAPVPVPETRPEPIAQTPEPAPVPTFVAQETRPEPIAQAPEPAPVAPTPLANPKVTKPAPVFSRQEQAAANVAKLNQEGVPLSQRRTDVAVGVSTDLLLRQRTMTQEQRVQSTADYYANLGKNDTLKSGNPAPTLKTEVAKPSVDAKAESKTQTGTTVSGSPLEKTTAAVPSYKFNEQDLALRSATATQKTELGTKGITEINGKTIALVDGKPVEVKTLTADQIAKLPEAQRKAVQEATKIPALLPKPVNIQGTRLEKVINDLPKFRASLEVLGKQNIVLSEAQRQALVEPTSAIVVKDSSGKEVTIIREGNTFRVARPEELTPAQRLSLEKSTKPVEIKGGTFDTTNGKKIVLTAEQIKKSSDAELQKQGLTQAQIDQARGKQTPETKLVDGKTEVLKFAIKDEAKTLDQLFPNTEQRQNAKNRLTEKGYIAQRLENNSFSVYVLDKDGKVVQVDPAKLDQKTITDLGLKAEQVVRLQAVQTRMSRRGFQLYHNADLNGADFSLRSAPEVLKQLEEQAAISNTAGINLIKEVANTGNAPSPRSIDSLYAKNPNAMGVTKEQFGQLLSQVAKLKGQPGTAELLGTIEKTITNAYVNELNVDENQSNGARLTLNPLSLVFGLLSINLGISSKESINVTSASADTSTLSIANITALIEQQSKLQAAKSNEQVGILAKEQAPLLAKMTPEQLALFKKNGGVVIQVPGISVSETPDKFTVTLNGETTTITDKETIKAITSAKTSEAKKAVFLDYLAKADPTHPELAVQKTSFVTPTVEQINGQEKDAKDMYALIKKAAPGMYNGTNPTERQFLATGYAVRHLLDQGKIAEAVALLKQVDPQSSAGIRMQGLLSGNITEANLEKAVNALGTNFDARANSVRLLAERVSRATEAYSKTGAGSFHTQIVEKIQALRDATTPGEFDKIVKDIEKLIKQDGKAMGPTGNFYGYNNGRYAARAVLEGTLKDIRAEYQETSEQVKELDKLLGIGSTQTLAQTKTSSTAFKPVIGIGGVGFGFETNSQSSIGYTNTVGSPETQKSSDNAIKLAKFISDKANEGLKDNLLVKAASQLLSIALAPSGMSFGANLKTQESPTTTVGMTNEQWNQFNSGITNAMVGPKWLEEYNKALITGAGSSKALEIATVATMKYEFGGQEIDPGAAQAMIDAVRSQQAVLLAQKDLTKYSVSSDPLKSEVIQALVGQTQDIEGSALQQQFLSRLSENSATSADALAKTLASTKTGAVDYNNVPTNGVIANSFKEKYPSIKVGTTLTSEQIRQMGSLQSDDGRVIGTNSVGDKVKGGLTASLASFKSGEFKVLGVEQIRVGGTIVGGKPIGGQTIDVVLVAIEGCKGNVGKIPLLKGSPIPWNATLQFTTPNSTPGGSVQGSSGGSGSEVDVNIGYTKRLDTPKPKTPEKPPAGTPKVNPPEATVRAKPVPVGQPPANVGTTPSQPIKINIGADGKVMPVPLGKSPVFVGPSLQPNLGGPGASVIAPPVLPATAPGLNLGIPSASLPGVNSASALGNAIPTASSTAPILGNGASLFSNGTSTGQILNGATAVNNIAPIGAATQSMGTVTKVLPSL